jgi:ubiquinone/menaquinone biosynthesis C-methylase UbiE
MTDNHNAVWDAHAATFDQQPDHGLQKPSVRAAWAALLASVLPPAPASIVDLGCGTGSLTTLLAEAGHEVYGVDMSAKMLDVARGKAAHHGVVAPLIRGDVRRPPLALRSFDVVLVRHVLWALHDRETALDRWVSLLRPQGRLVLIEGRWTTGAGLPAAEATRLLRRHGRTAALRLLNDDALWGKTITDERYLLLSQQ